MNEGLLFTRDFSFENYEDSDLYFASFGVLLLFSLPVSVFCLSVISFNIDQVLSNTPSAEVFLFETLTSFIRTGKPILVELIDLVNTVIIYSDYELLRLLRFLLGSPTDSHSPVLLDFVSSYPNISPT